MYVGRLSQEIYEFFDKDLQNELHDWAIKVLEMLYTHQSRLMEALYDGVGLTHDVKIFVRYNANKALLNVGFDPYFEDEEVNPIVLNGLNSRTKEMDFFSMKGNGYQSMVSESISDDDFNYILGLDNIANPIESAEKEKELSEKEFIKLISQSILDADIYSASKNKNLESTFLEYVIKAVNRLNGEINNRLVTEFLTKSDEEKYDDLLELYNSDGFSKKVSAENVKIVKWLIDFFDIEDENEDEEDYISDLDLTASYRRLLYSILKD